MMWVPAIATSFAAVVNIPVNLLLINYYGFPGAAAAFSVTRVLLFLFLIGEFAQPCPWQPDGAPLGLGCCPLYGTHAGQRDGRI